MKTIKEYADTINSTIDRIPLDGEPHQLYDPIIYTMQLPGKRLRPVLTLAAADALGGASADAIDAALAVEMFHNFTLLHDDIMDRSDTRRGHPTVFKRWGEACAILSGDAMLTIAGQMFMDSDRISSEAKLRIYREFTDVAMDVYRGQQYDMDFESRSDVVEAEYTRMIGLKTGALLGGACSIGAMSAAASDDVVKAMYGYGYALGIAFQLQDDLLDSFGDPATFGKPIGSDIRNDKKTWLNITACDEAPGEMSDAIAMGDDEKVAMVKAIYLKLHLPERCEEKVKKYLDQAIESLPREAMTEDGYGFFVDFAHKLIGRKK